MSENLIKLAKYSNIKWDENTLYSVNDIIQYNGFIYKCIQEGKGYQPDIESEYWEEFSSGGGGGYIHYVIAPSDAVNADKADLVLTGNPESDLAAINQAIQDLHQARGEDTDIAIRIDFLGGTISTDNGQIIIDKDNILINGNGVKILSGAGYYTEGEWAETEWERCAIWIAGNKVTLNKIEIIDGGSNEYVECIGIYNEGQHLTVLDCIINVEGDAIDTSASSHYLTVYGCTLSGNNGVNLLSNFARIEKSDINTSVNPCVNIKGSRATVVNNFMTSSWAGVYVDSSSSQNIIKENFITGGDDAGIWLEQGASECLIIGNIAYGHFEIAGIYIGLYGGVHTHKPNTSSALEDVNVATVTMM